MTRKKIISLMLLALGSICSAMAQVWHIFPTLADSITDMAVTPGKTYYLSGPNLFSFSPDDGESYAYTPINKLSGSGIAAIRYNPAGKYLAVIYSDSNIDILYDDGTVVNLPEIRDSQITGSKAINDIAFGEGLILVGTDFGIVVYDEQKMQVKESGIFNKPVQCVAIMAGRLLIYGNFGKGNFVMQSPIGQRHNSLDKFAEIGWGAFNTCLAPLDDTTILLIDKGNNMVTTRDINFDNNSWSTAKELGLIASGTPRLCEGGYYIASATGGLITAGPDGVAALDVPQMLQGQCLAIGSDPSRVWAGDAQGVALYDIATPSSPTVIFDKMRYAGAATCSKIGYMRFSPDGQRLYISNIETSVYKSYARGECVDAYQTTNIISDGFATDASLMEASADHGVSKKWQALHGNTRMYGDPAWIIEDPDDPDVYYCANNHEGLYVLRRNSQTGLYEEIGKFDTTNSPVPDNWGPRVQDVNIDPQGNLWIGYQKGAHYAVLPATKRRQGPQAVTAADWKEHSKLAGFDLDQKDMMSLFCRRSNMVFVFSGKDTGGLVAIDTKGTYDDPRDDAVTAWSRFTDQDGNSFAAPTRITFAIEDARGCVWIGTSAGIFEITRPELANSPTFTVRRIKVPRNDGTNYADYLLDSDQINWMAVDPSDRKWIATENSGIFLVSETGDKILANYTAENSPLMTNTVCSIECSPIDNTIYVGTAYGLYTLLGDAGPAAEDYSQILAYPNPVRPEYTGDVTITGLMDNSVVKIADSAGNVVYQTRSQGGMATWDVTDGSGSRVRSGVYFVYATSGSESPSGATTKIMVIN